MSMSSRKNLMFGIVSLLYGSMPHISLAAPALSVGVANAAPSQSVQVPVHLTDAGHVAAIQFDIGYDPAQLTSNDPVGTPALGAHGVSSSVIAAGTRRVVISPAPDNGVLAAGALVRLPFSVRATAAQGSRRLTVTRVVMSDQSSRRVIPGAVADGLIGDPGDTADDQDSDGMPDSWEIKYGLDPFNDVDAAADANDNGVSNLLEYRRGADPLKALSIPSRIYLAERPDPGGVEAGRIVAVDPVAGVPVASIVMSKEPGQLVAHPDGHTVYAAVGADLSVIDVKSNTEVNHLAAVTGTYPAARLVEDMTISPDGGRLYLVYRKTPLPTLEIKVFDTSTSADPSLMGVIDGKAFDGCYTPLGLGVNADDSLVYVACRPVSPSLPDRFYVVNAATGDTEKMATFPRDRSNLTFVNGITVSPEGKRVYVMRADSAGSTIEVFDGSDGRHIGSISLPGNALPRRGVISADGRRLYVVDQRLGTHVIDARNDVVLTTMSRIHSRGIDIEASADGDRLYSALPLRVFVLNRAQNRWVGTITGGFQHVFHLAVTPGGT